MEVLFKDCLPSQAPGSVPSHIVPLPENCDFRK